MTNRTNAPTPSRGSAPRGEAIETRGAPGGESAPTYPRCPACMSAAVALNTGACTHCPKCVAWCRIDCMHCNTSFKAFGTGWIIMGAIGGRAANRGRPS
jgi:hypothetical protein